MKVTELMTKAVVVVTPSDTIGRALRLLEECEIRHLPVLAGQELVGIVSDRDLSRYRLPMLEQLEHGEYSDGLLGAPVSEAMRTNVVVVDERESVGAAVEAIIECGVGAVPVVAHGTRHLVGMLSYVDVLSALRSGLLGDVATR